MSESRPRLFFALWPDAGLREELRAIAGRLPDEAGRKVTPENFHITLLFLGPTPAARIDPLLRAAAALSAAAPFQLSIDHAGWWRRSGIFWLAPAVSPPALDALVLSLAELARGQELAADTRDYRPHLTLLRKAARPPAAPAFPPLDWRAREFRLMESRTHADGPEYRELGRWPLRGIGPEGGT